MIKNTSIKLQREEINVGEVYNTSCDDLTSQVATSGKKKSNPTKHTSQVIPLNMHILEGINTQITRRGNTNRSRKRSLRQTTMYDTNAIDS